jgi:hypothetical protein
MREAGHYYKDRGDENRKRNELSVAKSPSWLEA